jgi:hypothetical protein
VKKIKSIHLLILAGAGAVFLLSTATGRSQVTLSLINPSSAPITPGSSFVLDAVASGLTSPALDGFNLTLAALPAGLKLISASSPLQNQGWSIGLSANFPNGSPQIDGLAGDPSEDISGSATIAEFDFTVASNSPYNVQDTISFIPEHTNTQDLEDSNSNPILPLTQNGVAVNIVPEPGILSLFLLSWVACGVFSSQWRRPCCIA